MSFNSCICWTQSMSRYCMILTMHRASFCCFSSSYAAKLHTCHNFSTLWSVLLKSISSANKNPFAIILRLLQNNTIPILSISIINFFFFFLHRNWSAAQMPNISINCCWCSSSHNRLCSLPVTGPVVTPTLRSKTENQPVLVWVAPIYKTKQWLQKSAHLVRKESPTKKEMKEEDEEDCSKIEPSHGWKEEEAELIKEVST